MTQEEKDHLIDQAIEKGLLFPSKKGFIRTLDEETIKGFLKHEEKEMMELNKSCNETLLLSKAKEVLDVLYDLDVENKACVLRLSTTALFIH